MVKTLKEFILNTTQLSNTGKEFSIKLFKSDSRKTISSYLVGLRDIDSDVIEYTIIKNKKVFLTFTIHIKDVESEAQVRYLLRSYCLEAGWQAIGTRDNKI